MNKISTLARHLNLSELMGAQFRAQIQELLQQKASGKKKTGPKPKGRPADDSKATTAPDAARPVQSVIK